MPKGVVAFWVRGVDSLIFSFFLSFYFVFFFLITSITFSMRDFIGWGVNFDRFPQIMMVSHKYLLRGTTTHTMQPKK